MKQRLLQILTSIALIITLTITNFLFLCVNFISYAIEDANIQKSTNHKNIEFMAYFKDEKQNKVIKKDAAINDNDLKLYFQIAVKQEGYFNGKITLKNANFRIKTDIIDQSISKIENNVIYLKQMNAGETKEVEVKIETLKDNQFDLNLINLNSELLVEGNYRNSTQKDIAISSKRTVSLILVSPYTNPNESMILSQNIITNKIFKIDNQYRRVIQTIINSGLKDNLFPIAETTLNIQAPRTQNEYPDVVLVNSNDILATNGKLLSSDDWSYNKSTGIVTINIKNTEENKKVSWVKEGTDNFVITYMFNKNIAETLLTHQNINVDSQIKLYDINKTVYRASRQIQFDTKEKDSIVTTEIIQNEPKIFKGKLYNGASRDITYRNVININLKDIAEEINVTEGRQQLVSTEIYSVYKTTRISKSSIENLLGQTGSIDVIDASTGKVVSSINKFSKADKDGYVVVSYPEGIQTVKFRIKSPVTIGKLEVESTRTISNINQNVLRNGTKIWFTDSIIYISNGNTNTLAGMQSDINLYESETRVNLDMSRTQLSAMTSNDNVEFRITLNSKEDKDKLFKNPMLTLQLPNKIQNIKINSVNLLYENEMKIQSANVINNNMIQVNLVGEQTKYKEEAVDGAIVIINANLQTNPRITSSTEQVKLVYRNNGDMGEVTKDIQIVSYAGLVTTNQIPEYGIDIINNEGNEKVQLELNKEAKSATINKRIINNKENAISNVRILGTFPTKEATNLNNIDIYVGEISVTGIDLNRVKVYYSNIANATTDLSDSKNSWTQTIGDSKNVKKYLIVIDQLNMLEEVSLSYRITVPSNLDYNKSAEEGCTIYYNNRTVQEQLNTKSVKFQTPVGTVLETTLKTLVAGQESNTVKEREVLRYQIIVENKGSETISNVVVNAKVPDGTVYVNSNKLNNEIDTTELVFSDNNKKEIEFSIEKLNSGEKAITYYEVQINDGMAGKNIKNSVTTKYGEVIKNSNEVTTLVNKGDNIEVKLVSMDAINNIVKSGYQYRYILDITNDSSKDIKKAKATINASDVLKISDMYYINSENKAVKVNNTNSIEIDKIAKGSTVQVVINTTVAIFRDTTSKEVGISAMVNCNGNSYNSNQINLTAKSELLFSMKASSENSGAYVKAGDVIKYNVTIKNNGEDTLNVVALNNWISNDVTLNKVVKDGVELSNTDYSLKIDNSKKQKILKLLNNGLKAGQTVEYQIEVVVNLLQGNTKAIEISSDYILQVEAHEIEKAKIIHILQPDEDKDDDDNNSSDDNDNDNNNDDNDNNDNDGTNKKYKLIHGFAWIDENENGQKDMSEKPLEGIEVKLLNAKTNKFVKDEKGNVLTVKTSNTGFYNFSKVEKGQYIVIFEYDNTQFGLTTFEKDGVKNDVNSNVITKTINVDGKQKQVAATEVITVADENISNINIGVVTAKKFDLQLDKYISKVTVQNNNVDTNTYTDATLVKQEIDAKQINSTTIIVEYTIKVTNKGDVTGYVKKIADYLPADFKFNSELNKDWYQSGNDVYSTSLSNTPIEPGQSRVITLTVIKDITENNTGLINNTAEIVESYNELGLKDINSTEGNKVKGENDMGSADLIISIRTGQILMTFSLIISSIVILGVAIVLLRKIIIR